LHGVSFPAMISLFLHCRRSSKARCARRCRAAGVVEIIPAGCRTEFKVLRVPPTLLSRIVSRSFFSSVFFYQSLLPALFSPPKRFDFSRCFFCGCLRRSCRSCFWSSLLCLRRGSGLGLCFALHFNYSSVFRSAARPEPSSTGFRESCARLTQLRSRPRVPLFLSLSIPCPRLSKSISMLGKQFNLWHCLCDFCPSLSVAVRDHPAFFLFFSRNRTFPVISS